MSTVANGPLDIDLASAVFANWYTTPKPGSPLSIGAGLGIAASTNPRFLAGPSLIWTIGRDTRAFLEFGVAAGKVNRLISGIGVDNSTAYPTSELTTSSVMRFGSYASLTFRFLLH